MAINAFERAYRDDTIFDNPVEFLLKISRDKSKT